MTGLTRDAQKLALAKELGADHVIDVEQEDATRRVKELTDGHGADVVVEVSSYATAPVAEALHYVAVGGRIVLAGVKGFKPVPDFVSDLIVVKEATIHGAFGVTARSYDAAIRLIESGRVPLAADAHARLRARRRRARDPNARRRDSRRGEHPLVPRTRRAPGLTRLCRLPTRHSALRLRATATSRRRRPTHSHDRSRRDGSRQ